jgi:iron complex outermembrane recepter protein
MGHSFRCRSGSASRACAGILLTSFLLAAAPLAAQPASNLPSPGAIGGVVRTAAGAPVADAAVVLVELHRTAITAADGSFSFPVVPPGRYSLEVASDRAGTAVADVAVAAGESRRVEVTVDVAAHREEIVVSAGAAPRSILEVAQPVSVMSGDELAIRSQASLGETLVEQPGVSSTYFGPAASRPIIRGLGGDRVRMLNEGIGTGDVSSTSPDHAVTSEPLSAERIEVLRGPATLLYGSSAIGGVVNVLDGRIPEQPAPRVAGFVDLRGGTVAEEKSLAAAVDGGAGAWAWHAEGVLRDTGDYDIPGFAESAALRAEEGHEEEHPAEEEAFGTLPNSDLETTQGSIGLSRFFGDAGYLGVAVSGMESGYGIPGGHSHGHEEHEGDEEEEPPVRIDLRQRRIDVAGHLHRDFGPFSGLQARAGLIDYEHRELEGADVGTSFTQDSWEGRVDLVQETRGSLSGAVGFQAQSRDLLLVGEEAFLPESATESWAAFAFEELARGDLRWQLGLRWEAQAVSAVARPDRSFDGLSSSLGLVWLPAGGRHSIGASLARSVKLPNVEELYSEGVHVATGSFQRGDADLEEETSLGLDVALRRITGRATGAVTLFATRFDDFIFERVTAEEVEGFPVLQFSQADARFVGAELEARISLLEQEAHDRHLDLELGGDWVRAELVDTDQPLPRIPPWRASVGLHYSDGPWNANLEVRHTAEQDRLAPRETRSEAYTLLNASLGYRLPLRSQVLDLLLRGRNLTDEEARPHTSFLKDLVPLPGRDVSLSARVTF